VSLGAQEVLIDEIAKPVKSVGPGEGGVGGVPGRICFDRTTICVEVDVKRGRCALMRCSVVASSIIFVMEDGGVLEKKIGKIKSPSLYLRNIHCF
jgi:hypothetical protein